MTHLIFKKHEDENFKEIASIENDSLQAIITELAKRRVNVANCDVSFFNRDIMVIVNETFRIYVLS